MERKSLVPDRVRLQALDADHQNSPVPQPPLLARLWTKLALPRRTLPDGKSATAWLPGRRIPWSRLTFIVFVILPTICCQFYLTFLAASQYLVEARFAVRTAEMESPMDKLQAAVSGMTLGSATTSSSSSQYAYIVSNYIKSRAMIDDLASKVDLRTIYRRPEADGFAKLKSDASIEDLRDYWTSMVNCYVDGPSGIVKLQVLAFRKDDALQISHHILVLSEKLVNEISMRMRDDAMKWSEQELRRTDSLVIDALNQLQKFRNAEGFIDPIRAADEQGKLLVMLIAQKIKLEGELFVAQRTLSEQAPSVQNLRNQLDSVESQVKDIKASMTGSSSRSKSIVNSLAKFEELELQRQFSEKLYTMAQDGLERARIAAQRQSVYLTVFVPPALPEDAAYPRRLAYSLALPFVFLVLWGIGALIAASVDDHRL